MELSRLWLRNSLIICIIALIRISATSNIIFSALCGTGPLCTWHLQLLRRRVVRSGLLLGTNTSRLHRSIWQGNALVLEQSPELKGTLSVPMCLEGPEQ